MLAQNYISKVIGLAACFLLVVQPLFSQTPEFRYGKNRIQYKSFNWQYFSTDNFDIYFYAEGEASARLAAEYMEKEYQHITDVLGYAPYSKAKIFLFNSSSDLQQSNVGIEGKKYTVGGQTNFVKLQVEVANPGTVQGLKDELMLQTTRMLINDMMYGGNLTDILQNAYLLTLPDWFIHGAARYIAEGWTIEMDDYMRDLAERKKIKKLSKYTGEEAGLIGQSIWNYMAITHGKSSISNVLNLTRIIRNEENSIESTLSISYGQFIDNWQNYYEKMAIETAEAYEGAPSNMRLRRKNRRGFEYSHVKISPDGKHVAYAEKRNGKYKVIIKEAQGNKKRVVLKGGIKPLKEKTNEQLPLLNWKDSKTLGIISASKGNYFLWQYDVDNKSMSQMLLDRFVQVKDFSFSPNGNVAVLSADTKGKNDLYLMSVTRGSARRVTNDLYDDLNPVFIPGTSLVVFSSNRVADSLNTDLEKIRNSPEAFNLFVYDVNDPDKKLVKLTNGISRNYKPLPVDEQTIFFLSDEKGIVNLFKYNLQDSTYQQVSNFNSSILEYDLHYRIGALTFTMEEKGKEYLYFIPNYPFEREKFTQSTTRQQVMVSKYVKDNKSKTSAKKTKADPALKDQKKTINAGQSDGTIDTDNYNFEPEVVKEEIKENFFLQQYREYEEESGVEGPYTYRPRFSASNILTSLRVDPLFGYTFLFEVEMSDMLENHKFYAGLQPSIDFQSGMIFAEYQYLKNRLDYHLRYDRRSLFRAHEEQTEIMHRYVLNRIESGASLPISVSSRISASPFFVNTTAVDLDPRKMVPRPSRQPIDTTIYYAGLNVGFTLDNTEKHGLNMLSGTRLYTGFEHYQAINAQERSFSNFVFDFRHYQSIFREFVIASRVLYGQYFSTDNNLYLLGGMANDIFNFNDIDNSDEGVLALNEQTENSDILFAQFVTPMRGFSYNSFNGNSVFLFNVEARLPIVKIFYRGPIESNFFRNLQLIGFLDAGTAWSGGSPFSEDNSLNTEVISTEGSVFRATLQNYKSPLLIGYGAGIRTVLFGYYLKFDAAWPYEDYEVGDPRFYLTLGMDF